MTLAAIPSPTVAVWQLGPVPVRAYALCIVAGIVIACVVTEARLRSRGAPRYAVLDLALWAVPFGIVGARVYHVVTSPSQYFGEGGDPIRALYIWEGGLGIWGAIAFGALGVWLCCRYQLKLPLRVVADAAAVGIPLAQAVGRLGNWFNNELYGARADNLPWGLRIHQMQDGRAVLGPDGQPLQLEGLYHPTFLYELLWNVAVAVLVWRLGARLRLGAGRQFALYVAGYTAGRFWIEMLRIDGEAEGTTLMVLGTRLNVWVAAVVFLAAVLYLWRVRGGPEYLLPVTAAGGAPTGDGAAPAGYRVVTEAEYRAALAGQSAPEATGGGDAEARTEADGGGGTDPDGGGDADGDGGDADDGTTGAQGAPAAEAATERTGRADD